MRTAIRIEAGNRVCEDRAELMAIGDTTYLMLADGAGGISGGALAAQMLLDIVRPSLSSMSAVQPQAIAGLLAEANKQIETDSKAGETTGIVAVIADGQVFGASAGDSEAWIFSQNDRINLTSRQAKSRRLGTAEAWPVPFGPVTFDGTLVVGSDGLWKYTSIDRIAVIALTTDLELAASQLIDAVRLRSGELSDDVSLMLCRRD